MQSKKAKRRGRELSKTYAFWFRRKYNLAPNDAGFLALTPEEVEAEYWAHFYAENGIKEEFEDDDFDVEALLAEAAGSSGGAGEDEWETVVNERT